MMLKERLLRSPVIAAIRDFGDISIALKKKVEIIFLLVGGILDLMEIRKKIKSGPLLFSHLDLIEGIGKDREGMRFLSQKAIVDGILTTRSYLIKCARKEGLFAIQRLFILDSEALRTGLGVIKNSRPDAIEILPGIILPKLENDLGG